MRVRNSALCPVKLSSMLTLDVNLFIWSVYFVFLINDTSESEEEVEEEQEERQPSPEPLQDSPNSTTYYEPHPVM